MPTGSPNRGTIIQNGALHQTIQFRRNQRALPFLDIIVERTTDLGPGDDWSTGETTEAQTTVNAQDPDIIDVIERSMTAISGQTREFLQVCVCKR